MTALAHVLKARGASVSGSDMDEVFFTDKVLEKSNITCKFFSEEHITSDIDLVIYSTAYDTSHPEIQKAKKLHIPTITYPQGLGMLFEDGKGIAVAGSHGKTTTTALLGTLLERAGLDPTVIVGSAVPQFSGNARVGVSNLTIIEADEYQNKFQYYKPFGVVLTNIDYDHPDFFATQEAYDAAFEKFLKKIPAEGFLVYNADDRNSVALAKNLKGKTISYGVRVRADIIARNLHTDGRATTFDVVDHGKVLGSVELPLFGEHNVSNALAAIAAARSLGAHFIDICTALAEFKGTKRRFEKIGTYNNALVYDDYAHHPAEITATLTTAKEQFPEQRLVCLFHPHTFSRTKVLFNDFVTSLGCADMVWVMDIYGSAREQQGTMHAEDLVTALQHNKKNAVYVGNLQEAEKYAKTHLRENDILFTMGAGDVWKIGEELVHE